MTTDARRAGSRWARVVTDNLGLKTTAFGLSLLLFYLVHSDNDAQRAIYIDVVALLPPPGSGKMLISELPAQVKVTLRGSRSKLSSLSRDELQPIQLDLREVGSGHFYIDASLVDVGSNIQVVEISPSMVPLTWADEGEKRVPIEALFDGELGRGLELSGEVEIEPSYVTLRGPQQLLKAITAVSTEPLSLVRLDTGAHTRRLPLEPLPEHVSYVEDTAAEVHVTVAPAVAEQTLKRLEVAVLGDAKVDLRPEHVAVELHGTQELLDQLDADALVPYVQLDPNRGAGTHPYDVQLRGVPEGVTVATISPPSVLARPKGKP